MRSKSGKNVDSRESLMEGPHVAQRPQKSTWSPRDPPHTHFSGRRPAWQLPSQLPALWIVLVRAAATV
jgi:hypothetical protein